MSYLSRLASERATREQAEADLRFLKCLTAVMGLMFGSDEGRRAYIELEEQLRAAAFPDLVAREGSEVMGDISCLAARLQRKRKRENGKTGESSNL